MNLKWTALTVALGVALTVTCAQAATDFKDYHASGGCKVYGATPWTSLGFGWQGISNTTTSPVQIVCPIIKDSVNAWDGSATTPVHPAYLHLHGRNGNVAANVTCSVFANYANTLASTTTTQLVMAANTLNWSNTSAALTSYQDWDQGVLMMCQLGPKASLVHYTVEEYDLSESP